MLNDSVVLRLSAHVPDDIGAIEVNYYYIITVIIKWVVYSTNSHAKCCTYITRISFYNTLSPHLVIYNRELCPTLNG